MTEKKKRSWLIPKLLLGIAAGILIGKFLPMWCCQLVVTFSTVFSEFLKFVIPLMVLAFVTAGIADISRGAGRLLLITALLSYASTLIFGTGSFIVADNLFPSFISKDALEKIASTEGVIVEPFMEFKLAPVMDTISAVVLAFILGLCMVSLRGRTIGDTLYNGIHDLSAIIEKTLNTAIVPLLPLYVCGTFTILTRSGKSLAILSVIWKVFLVVIIMHIVCIFIQFLIAGAISKKNPFKLIVNQVPAYLAALGTQSSVATIPVNLESAKADGICEQVRNFVIPLCANIHMAGSMITLVACSTAVCLMSGIPIGFDTVIPFILVLGVAMVASPGAPGGSVMTALPFFSIIFGEKLGAPDGTLCAIMIAIYITQDSFGTACNISGDNALGVIIDKIYKNHMLKNVQQ